jgi:hypothetical protein
VQKLRESCAINITHIIYIYTRQNLKSIGLYMSLDPNMTSIDLILNLDGMVDIAKN